jgi:hypothetical protein
VFFSEEKNQKTFIPAPVERFRPAGATEKAKVFWFFSSEKNAFLLSWRPCFAGQLHRSADALVSDAALTRAGYPAPKD